MRGCFFFFLFFLFITISTSTVTDTLNSTQILRINQTLESLQGSFVLGFISPTSSNVYLAIWYKNIPDTVVWVANRDNPLQNSTDTFLKITDDGNIVLLNSSTDSNNLVWSSSNQTNAKNQVLVLQLLDTGNLVLRETNVNDPTKYLWQSFDHPTDTLLPNMTMGWNFDKNTEKHLTSWKVTGEDPSSGDYSLKVDFHGLPEFFLRNDDRDSIIFRTGPWNGERFSGVPEMQSETDSIVFSFSSNEHAVNYSFSIGSKSIFSRLVVNSNGKLQRLIWVQSSKTWTTFWDAPKDECDNYKECGPYGLCDSNALRVCECVKGFSPKNEQAWKLRDGSDGCVRDKDLDCKSDKFYRMEKVKLPKTTSVFVNTTMDINECRELCHRNCSCTGYANVYISNGGSGCVMWIGELNDIRNFSDGGQDLFVRLSASELLDNSSSTRGSHKKNPKAEIIGITTSVVAVIVLGVCILLCKKMKLLSHRIRNADDMDELDLPMFDFNTIIIATNNFLEANKLGHGGFGSVYKGRLAEGQEIAVKRLSETSGQGNEEFKNEVKLIAKLQHRNLVRLLGYCIDKDEKILVYEYMENRSLDSILFDKARKPLLDWKKRFYVICGIARGLHYLHHDSRLRIIHRDLKASNILLDGEMIPKISDFGMARIFAHDQTEAKTLRVVGTYGYMSPEYAMDGNFSVKSDVFSFGVIMLEIISGKKNRGFYYTDDDMNLLKNAWEQWREGNALKLVDSSISDSYTESEVLRCIHVGLLCVQEHAEDRPTMPLVLLMLGSENALKPEPRSPGFSLGRSKNPPEVDSSSSKQDETWSVNQVTVTLFDAR